MSTAPDSRSGVLRNSTASPALDIEHLQRVIAQSGEILPAITEHLAPVLGNHGAAADQGVLAIDASQLSYEQVVAKTESATRRYMEANMQLASVLAEHGPNRAPNKLNADPGGHSTMRAQLKGDRLMPAHCVNVTVEEGRSALEQAAQAAHLIEFNHSTSTRESEGPRGSFPSKTKARWIQRRLRLPWRC